MINKINNIIYPKFNIIYAHDEDNGIGFNNKIPWDCPQDRTWFRQWTTKPNMTNYIIMGKNTYQSLVDYGLKMKNRYCVVISKTLSIKYTDNIIYTQDNPMEKQVVITTSLDEALLHCQTHNKANYPNSKININVIGGAQLYQEAQNHPCLDKISKSVIFGRYNCDIKFTLSRSDIHLDNTITYADNKWDTYLRIEELTKDNNLCCRLYYGNSFETQYRSLVNDILQSGNSREDRTGTGTISLFDRTISCNLQTEFPLLTGKMVPLRLVAEELFWFIRGQTDAKILQDKGVHIWDQNSSKEFLQGRGLDYEEGNIGPGYGYQWRTWGGDSSKDQIQEVIHLLTSDPTSRRIIVSAWNVSDLDKMALPPCHLLFQFYTRQSGVRTFLDCKVIMRSTDVMLGLPFNMASYALLTIMLSMVVGMEPGILSISMGDTHIYMNHIDGAKEYMSRNPYLPPKLEIIKKLDSLEDIEQMECSDINLYNYNHHGIIKMDMS